MESFSASDQMWWPRGEDIRIATLEWKLKPFSITLAISGCSCIYSYKYIGESFHQYYIISLRWQVTYDEESIPLCNIGGVRQNSL
jgi:hypothetical protein